MMIGWANGISGYSLPRFKLLYSLESMYYSLHGAPSMGKI